jgi:hypothetical protein
VKEMLIRLITKMDKPKAAAAKQQAKGSGSGLSGDAALAAGFDFGTTAATTAPTASSPPEAIAEQALRDWEDLRYADGVETRTQEQQQQQPLSPLHILSIWPIKDLLKYWRDIGRHKYELLSKVVMACAATDGAAAEIERDWCVASDVITDDRGSLDPAYFEMVMFLRSLWGGREPVLPDSLLPHLAELSDEDIKDAIPDRLLNLFQQQLADLDSDIEQEEDDMEVDALDTPDNSSRKRSREEAQQQGDKAHKR